jgi:hypothetical protein
MASKLIAQKGLYFDLPTIFERLNQQYFDGGIKARLRWGKRYGGRAIIRRSVRLGSYYDKEKVITINPILDQAMVPLICLERVLFHEMGHQKFAGAKTASGKNSYHSKEFYAFEKNYPFLKEADLWISANLPRLLRSGQR